MLTMREKTLLGLAIILSIALAGSKPYFDTTFKNVTAQENLSLEIICEAEGESPITYEWYDQNEDKISGYSNSSTIYVSQLSNGSALIIPKLTLDDAGVYTCSARNRHGLSSKIFQLMVLSEEDDPTNGSGSLRGVSVANVTTTSVQFDLDLSGPVDYIEVLYTESRNGTSNYTFKYGDIYEIKFLIPAGLYFFQFRTSKDTQWSKSYRVVLLPERPEVIFRSIDSGTVKLEWFFKFEDRMRKTIDRHEITYFTVQRVGIEEKWISSNCPITIRIPECNSAAYTISGLGLRVYYEIQLRAHTEAGYGEPYIQKIYFP